MEWVFSYFFPISWTLGKKNWELSLFVYMNRKETNHVTKVGQIEINPDVFRRKRKENYFIVYYSLGFHFMFDVGDFLTKLFYVHWLILWPSSTQSHIIHLKCLSCIKYIKCMLYCISLFYSKALSMLKYFFYLTLFRAPQGFAGAL